MTSPHDPRRGLTMFAVTILAAVASGDAVAQHNQHNSEMTMPPGGAPAAQMNANGDMEMPMGHDGGDGAGTAMPDGDSMGAQGDHAMPDMQTMGTLASNLHEVHLAATQRVLAHKTTIYALLVALGIDRERNSALLRQAQGQFEQVQAGLRDGDEARGLEGSVNSTLRVKLQEVDIYWSHHSAVVQQILDQPTSAVGHVTMLTITDADLHRSLKSMAEAVERYSYEGRGYSILLPTVRHAQHLSAMVQQLAADFLLVAYGHDVTASEQALRATATQFDLILDALTNGNSELHVLGAPTPEILAQYGQVRTQWRECWSAIEAMPAGHHSDPGMIGSVLSLVERVAVEVDVAVGLYHYL